MIEINMFEKRDKVECVFVGIYLIEQVALIVAYNFQEKLLPLWIALFPVIFLTTIAFEKVFLKSDFKDQLDGLLNEKQREKTRNMELKTMRANFSRNKKWSKI